MKKLVFFPFHHDLKTLLQNKDRIIDAEVSGVLSYKEDYIMVENLCNEFGVPVKTYEQTLNDCDCVIILDNYRNYNSEKYYRVIKDAAGLGKEILITPLAASQLELSDYTEMFSLLKHEPYDELGVDERYNFSRKDRLYDLDVPVIGVLGQGKNCEKFECQLLIDEVLGAECKTAVLSSNALGALFGYYTMPDFLFAPLPFAEKVFKFNSYVRMIAKTELPDLFIVGIPGGVVPFEKREMNDFAEYPLVITTAISVDIGVLSTYFAQGGLIEAGIQAITGFCEERFRLTIGAVNFARVTYDIPEAEIFDMIYEFLNDEYVAKHRPKFEDSKLPLFDLYNKERAMSVIKEMTAPLSENVRAI